MDLGFTLGVDADPVRHCRHGSEGPARAAAPLVSDLLDGGTVCPLLPGVKTGRKVPEVSQHFNRLREVEVSVREDSHQSTEVLVARLRVETDQTLSIITSYFNLISLLPARSPSRVCIVESLYEVVREDVVVVLGLHHHTGDHHQK